MACRAVIKVPERSAASTTITRSDMPLMMRLRWGKVRQRSGKPWNTWMPDRQGKSGDKSPHSKSPGHHPSPLDSPLAHRKLELPEKVRFSIHQVLFFLL